MDLRPLEAFIFEKMASSRLPGLSLALVRDGKVAYARGFGQRDLGRGLPATPDTLYCIGSVTKSFTALAILKLREQGLLDLGDPVARFLPFTLRPAGGTVTIEHLLTHTIGTPALAYSEALIGHANGTGGRWLPIAGPSDVLLFMQGAQEWVECAPGERWAYANEGYALLGAIIEKLSDRSYRDYIREEILIPLGMSRSFLTSDEVEAAADVAVPYVLAPGEPPRPGRYLCREIRSEGGLVSSATDMARYLSMFLSGGNGVASKESLAEMMEPRIPQPQQTAPDLLGRPGEARAAQHYGYGLQVEEDFYGQRLVAHGGSVLVSTAHMAFLPGEGIGVIVLANGSGYPLSHLARFALAVALNRDPLQLAPIAMERELERMTGRYRAYRDTMAAAIERSGDFLLLRFEDRADPAPVVLVPERLGGTRPAFYTLSEGRRLPVAFRLDDAGGAEVMFERYKLRRVGLL